MTKFVLMKIRVAQFNVAMSFPKEGQLYQELDKHRVEGTHQLRFQRIAATLQQIRPDILLLCEFDHQADDRGYSSIDLFLSEYCGTEQLGQKAIDYPYRYLAPSNTGTTLATALTGKSEPRLPEDGVGFGCYPGHFNFVLLSKYPIKEDEVMSWRQLAWANKEDHSMPSNYYVEAIANELKLSSKNHIKLPLDINGQQLNLVYCHPTPPVFDGEEQRNFRRNSDEIKLLVDILDNADYLRQYEQEQVGYIEIIEDENNRYPSKHNEKKPQPDLVDGPFVILGDLNNDVLDGDGDKAAMTRLLKHSRIHHECANGRLRPKSRGGFFYHLVLKRRGIERKGKPAYWTHLNGLRLDYVLPSAELHVVNSGVFWPEKKELYREWLEDSKHRQKEAAYTDHRMVWVDVVMPSAK